MSFGGGNVGFEIDDILNDTVMGIPREELAAMLNENVDEKQNNQEVEFSIHLYFQ